MASHGRVMLMRGVGSLWGVGVGKRHGWVGKRGMLVVFHSRLWVVCGGQAGCSFTANLTLL